MNREEALIILGATERINGKTVQPFLDMFGSYEALLTADALREISAISAAGKKLAVLLSETCASCDYERARRLMDRHNVRLIAYDDDAYPRLLREIADPPLVLYVRGMLPLTQEHLLSIVGSRNASFYGLQMAERFGREVSEKGITVVSGLARGIDAAAHTGALAGRGKTIAVLGCGVDIAYPPRNRALYERIVAEGAVVSEFGMEAEPLPFHFPMRNRIIAGMASGVLVVEASARSGSLITARCALDEGRAVYSVPGKIDSLASQGSNRLLKSGSTLVECVDDILVDFPDLIVTEKAQVPAPCRSRCLDRPRLSARETAIVRAIADDPSDVDMLCAACGVAVQEMMQDLLGLELRKVIRKRADGKFCVVT